ncbi:hypothetical protein FC91_GL001835 [Schleiferilactobacillus harbinensis DSM 16991]|uniref:Uncharacterized protein n=1 Tax=Schleiferilactobacillus harbinensis DSM 16991 TaxID=1122147 RepID=A0A0R1XP09_9LACO|nr:hypothetical protein FC91_GL001835 [Schleiferilactobacillus harbinensis DSM 16991]
MGSKRRHGVPAHFAAACGALVRVSKNKRAPKQLHTHGSICYAEDRHYPFTSEQ